MTITTIIADSQIIVPKKMLQALPVQTGDTVAIENLSDRFTRSYPKTQDASEVAAC